MFNILKKKISGWFSNKKEETTKTSKKKEKKVLKEKVETKLTKENKKESKNLTKKEKKLETEVKKIIEDSEKQIEEEKSQESTEEKGNFFTKLLKKITSSNLTEEDFEEAFADLEITLLENNVALEAVDKIKESLSKDLVGNQIKKIEAPARIKEYLKEAILNLLVESQDLVNEINESKEPYVILFFGINGTGKTTSLAKLSYYLKEKGISSVLAAGDTFRAASIEQLKTHADKIKVPFISQQYGSDPAAVAFDAISYAKKNKIKAVLIDTAGRMYTKDNLMKEMEKIIRISKPNLKIFVGESITGNDAIEQAKTFNDSAGIDGIILTKADIDEKAGTILSVSYITKKPIFFLGTGQEYKDFQVFKKKEVLKNLGLD
jgi:fused signal recognition particle receptor